MTPQAEFGPDVSDDEERHPETHIMSGAEMKAYYAEHPAAALRRVEDVEQEEPSDYDADRAWAMSLVSPEAQALLAEPYKSAARNALIAKGAALATKVERIGAGWDKKIWLVRTTFDSHPRGMKEQGVTGDTLAEALIALAEATDAA